MLNKKFFQVLNVTLSPFEYLTVEHATFTTFEKTKITVKWGFPHTSKQIYRKLQYREKVFGEFQGLPRFPRKMVCYFLTKLDIIKLWTNIQSLKRLNLGFWQASKQTYRKLKYREKVSGEVQGLPCFPREMVLYRSTKFGIINLWTNIGWLRRFDWRSKLQCRENAFGKFQVLPCFSRKTVLYWFKALECQICSANIKPFFWESEKNRGTLQKLSPYNGVSYKFVLKSVESLNRIFWVIEYWFKAL